MDRRACAAGRPDPTRRATPLGSRLLPIRRPRRAAELCIGLDEGQLVFDRTTELYPLQHLPIAPRLRICPCDFALARPFLADIFDRPSVDADDCLRLIRHSVEGVKSIAKRLPEANGWKTPSGVNIVH